MGNADSDMTIKHLQSEHCNNDVVCNGMITEITPRMMKTLATWMMENQSDICEFDKQDPVLNSQCNRCNEELGGKINQILTDRLIPQRKRLFGKSKTN